MAEPYDPKADAEAVLRICDTSPDYLDRKATRELATAAFRLARWAAGDDGPVTAEWLESIGFVAEQTPGGDFNHKKTVSEVKDDSGTLIVVLSVFPVADEWGVDVWNQDGEGFALLGSWFKTRGECRRLLAALGAAPAGESRPTEE
jgi:hypothetical protein